MAINYEYIQSTPSDVWIVNHGLGVLPNLDVIIEENGVRQKVLVDKVLFLDEDNVELRFSTPREGSVRFSTEGSLPFPAYDEFTITEEIVLFPNARFVPLAENIATNINGINNDTSIVVDSLTGKMYTAFANKSTDEVTVVVYEDVIGDPQFVELKRTVYSGYTGNQDITGLCVWNNIIYFISHGFTNSQNNPTSSGFNDFKLWKIDLNNDTFSEYLYPASYGGFSGIDTDGEFLYALTFEGAWFKLPLDEPSNANVLELVNLGDNPGLPSSIVPSFLAYDQQTGFFQIGGRAGFTRTYVLDGYNGTVLDNRYETSRQWFEFDNFFVYGGYLVGTANRRISNIGYAYNSTNYPPKIDTTTATQLCDKTPSQIISTSVNYQSILNIRVDCIYPSNYDGKVYVYSDQTSTIYVFSSILDNTIEHEIVLSTPAFIPIHMVVYEGKAHFYGGLRRYSRHVIDYDNSTAQQETEFEVSIPYQKTTGTAFHLDVYNDQLWFFNKYSSQMRPFQAPLDVANDSQLDATVAFSYANWAPRDMGMDTITGYLYVYYSQGGGRATIVHASPRSSVRIKIYSNESGHFAPIGNWIFERTGNFGLRGGGLPDTRAVHNNICLI